ncbi:MAG: hypothetical protein OXG30_14530 [bacterium]|nr:hypothetical protein [bacterium]MCY4136105.1 hypothetical protein [bacterium]
MGIVSACAAWITDDSAERADPAGDEALVGRARELAHRLAGIVGAVVSLKSTRTRSA